MTVFEELEKQLTENPKWHCFTIGKCTMAKTPGYFAMIFEANNVTCVSKEGSTPQDAATNLLQAIQPPRKMPGM